MFAITADPTVAVVDAIKARLEADATLTALVTGIYGHISEAARVAYPYLVLGRRTSDSSSGAMGIAGGRVTLQIDGWSAAKGPHQITAIGSRVYAVLYRHALQVTGFAVVEGSLERELQEIFDEPDEDKPAVRLYRLVQRWGAEIHEAA